MHLSIIRQHFKQGFQSVARLIESFELQIEKLSLAQSSDFHTVCLEQTVETQKNEITRLNRTLKNKSQQLLDSQRSNHQLQLQIEKRDRYEAQLKARIRELETCLESDSPSTLTRDSHNSNLPPSLDPPWNKPKRTRSLRTRSGLKVGGQIGHRGHTLLQVADPDTIIVHRVDVCIHCQNSLIPVESRRCQRRQIFEIENGRLAAIEHRIEIKHCRVCRQTTKAQFPPGLTAPVQYGTSVFSRIVYLNQYQLLPVARTAESMKDLFECPVSLATIQRAAKVCSHQLMRYEYQLKAAVRNSEVIGADETGIRINGQMSWVHVARTGSLTHFAAHPKRGREAFEDIGIINRFEGVLVRDGWTPYRKYEQCRHSLCNAHLLRDLTFVGENEPRHREWTDKLAGLLLEIKASVEATRSKEQSSRPGCEQQRYSNHYDGILEQAEQSLRGSPVRRTPYLCAPTLYRRFCNNKTEILRFMTDFSVPFDNNGSERDLRMLKLQQKISGCFRSAAGASVFCRVRSFLSSARKQGRVLLTALESALKDQPIGLII